MLTMKTPERGLAAQLLVGVLLGAAPLAASAETVLITGANSGLGLEFTKQYAAKGWTVIATHRRRDVPETLAEVVAEYPQVRVETLDVTSLEQAQALAAKLEEVPIDVVINNAGVYNDRSSCAAGDDACPGNYQTQSFGQLDFALLDTIMDVNIKGPLIVSQAFYPNVKASALKKIVAISSSNGTITGELPSVKPDGVTVVILNPGPTLTEHQEYLRGNPIMLEMSFTVKSMIDTIARTTVEETGQFWRYDGVPEKW